MVSCKKCRVLCHKSCDIISKNINDCVAISHGNCIECPGKCGVEDHKIGEPDFVKN